MIFTVAIHLKKNNYTKEEEYNEYKVMFPKNETLNPLLNLEQSC